MRVVSFILLGLFYNKFAEAIKALLDDEQALPANEIKPAPVEAD